jgi:ureidoacrylate peracid hydrolase
MKMTSILSRPTLVLIDIQKEYTTPGKPFCLAGIGPSRAKCRRLLREARASQVRIVHVQHLQDGPVFGRNSTEAEFVDGFEPMSTEAHLIKSKLSSYTHSAFANIVSEAGAGQVFVAGYGSTMCCMATVVDAALFGHKLNFIHDASWARAAGTDFTEQDLHLRATSILGIHGKLATTAEAIAHWTSRTTYTAAAGA